MNQLALREAVETVSIKNNIEPDTVLEVIKDTIIDEVSSYLDVIDERLVVDIDEQFSLTVFLLKEVVEKKEHPILHLTQSQAELLLPKEELPAKLGQLIKTPVEVFSLLSRRDIKQFNYVLSNRLKNIKKHALYVQYKAREGQLVSGHFLRKYGRDLIIDLGEVEGRLPYREQRFQESYRQGDLVKCYLKQVKLDERERLFIELSRVDVHFVVSLFESEVEEIRSGIVKIRSIVREAGRKTKVSVFSTRPDVEPVRACIGLYGNRIKAIMKELGGERIDVIAYSPEVKEYIARAMEPGKVSRILLINEAEKEALVVVDDESYPLAIGRNGINVKLAARLLGWELSIRAESQLNKHPAILKVFSKIDSLFKEEKESDFEQLEGVDETVLLRFLKAGITTVAELYEKTVEEMCSLAQLSKEEALKIRKTLDEMVEVVEEEELREKEASYQSEIEDELGSAAGLEEEEYEEEIQQIEYVACPSCSFEFEYSEQEKCPSCGAEFEVE